ncbi:NAD(P) transhydrogenase subunit alpha [Streptomyces sp. AV19]|uniref:NAD(P) transhydrogenase subunit alpha n=1 Tax=Streptomyces sp. AV19 TaxID=2793068 RepID=UPI0018FE7582|nr:NAD(P) transhydrogenase subunit alpha [Streptomyces sp. AV19]MBH1934298.1 NAD(P) transhydrogenase subunit alpha [Streptomyces sp. AV19]MDG4533393.1 NAD(P) transhydrogenase subunit alpha [Streptomyces sp. AV19]
MTGLTVGVYKETVPGERRVALVPESVRPLQALGLAVAVESGAGAPSRRPDDLYRRAGADTVTLDRLLDRSDVLVGVRPPNLPAGRGLRRRQTLIALLDPLRIPFRVRDWADGGVTSIGLDLAPQDSVLARPMDAVASQGRLAGYKAALLAADRLDRPLHGTADAAPEPARALVLGVDPAAAEAAATLRRLGAEVRVHDRLAGSPAGVDVLVTTLRPRRGRPPPRLVAARDLADMRAGSVVVDLTAGPGGGNVDGVRPDHTDVVGPGVTLIGAGRLAEDIPGAASTAYARNVQALLEYVVRDGGLWTDPDDPVLRAMLVTHDRLVRDPDVWQLILGQTAVAGLP